VGDLVVGKIGEEDGRVEEDGVDPEEGYHGEDHERAREWLASGRAEKDLVRYADEDAWEDCIGKEPAVRGEAFVAHILRVAAFAAAVDCAVHDAKDQQESAKGHTRRFEACREGATATINLLSDVRLATEPAIPF
jgi:hypothetical protein